MTIENELRDKTIDVFEKIFQYINNQNTYFLVYGGREFPLSNRFLDCIEQLKEKDITFKFKCLKDIKGYNRDAKLVVFTLLINNMGINDITYQYNSTSYMFNLKYKKDLFQVFINCHYTEYRKMIAMCNDAMTRTIDKVFSSKQAQTV